MSGTITGTYPLFTKDQLNAAQANMQEASDTVGATGQSFSGFQGGVQKTSAAYIDATCEGVPFYVFSDAPFPYVKAVAALGAGNRVLQPVLNQAFASGKGIETRSQYLALIDDVLQNVLLLKPFPLNFLKTGFAFNQY